MCPLLQSIDTREIDGVLVEILKHVGDKENGHDSEINFAEHSLELSRVCFNTFAVFVQLVIIIYMHGESWRDLINSLACWLSLRLSNLLF
jgi:uncharacterized MAPEG superfamily protein